MNFKHMPKHNEVTDIDMGGGNKMQVVELTPENRAAVLDLIMDMYLDDVCMYCFTSFTREQLQTAKVAYPNKHGRIVHKECWEANNPEVTE